MEKIQQALAKARAERQDGRQTRPVVAPIIAEPPAADRSVEDAWAALPEFQADPDQLAQARVMTLRGGHDATAFDVMRTKVLQTMRANNWRRLAITSPTPACGKSTVSLNLGFSLARQPDVRSIVAELDLRRPSLAKTLKLAPAKNFAEVLQDKADFTQNAVRFGQNLALAVNSGIARNPSEVLQSARVPAILADIEARFAPDLMIFDLPPMFASDDTMAFVGQVDCVLLIAGAEATTVKEIDTCERELASQTNVMGVVLNKCHFMGKDYGYSYYG